MRSELPIESGKEVSLEEKVAFLMRPGTYAWKPEVRVIETHMSWVFLAGKYVYKLKKPVIYDFLDFQELESRHRYCLEEVSINKALAPKIYLGVVPLVVHKGRMKLNGRADDKVVDWMVKMKRLPEDRMLNEAISKGTARTDWVQLAAEKLVDFYLSAQPVKTEPVEFMHQLVREIEYNSSELLRKDFDLPHQSIVAIETNLIHCLLLNSSLFNSRIEEGKVIECHGDLRPEHICLGTNPVIIDRIEFNPALRIMDIAEELAFFALECEMLGAPAVGQLFLNVYRWKSHDKVPEKLIAFYKAKRAYLRAKLCIHHLLEKEYIDKGDYWRNRSLLYLSIAESCGKRLSDGAELSSNHALQEG